MLATRLPIPVLSPTHRSFSGRRKRGQKQRLLARLQINLPEGRQGENMRLQAKIATSIGLTLVLAVISFAQQVKSDYDHNVNFGQYKTYSWEKIQTQDPLVVDRIKAAVNGTLAAKGWTEVPSGGDVEVFAIETTQNQQTLDTFYNGFGGGRRWGFGGGFGNSTTTVETYKVGTLVVDLFDAKTEKLIWRSSSSDTLSNNADKNTKNLNKAVTKMFKHFPPNTGSGK
jgi:hypothetical protein